VIFTQVVQHESSCHRWLFCGKDASLAKGELVREVIFFCVHGKSCISNSTVFVDFFFLKLVDFSWELGSL
jgi:hypothetical protein